MNYKCKKCGESFNVDDSVKNCPVCNTPIDMENDASGSMKVAHEKKIQKESDLKALVAEYNQTGDSKDIKAILPTWDEYTNLPNFNRVWRDFIVNAAGAAVTRKDKDLQFVLKNHARDFDSAREGSDLLHSLLKVHTKIGGINDWADLIERTGGDRTKFAVICDSIIYRIVKNNDKGFASEVFNYIKSRGESWVEVGSVYVRALLHNEEIASNVLSVKAFGITSVKFAKDLRAYCKKYLEKTYGIDIEQSKVWENYLAACKARKRHAIVVSAVVGALLVAAALGVIIFLNSINKGTIAFNVDKVIDVIYTQEPEGDDGFLKGYTISYKLNSGKAETIPLEADHMVGYDPEKIGEQTVRFEFKGVSVAVTIVIKNAQLDAPVLKQEGNRVTWEPVLHATEYAVYVNATTAETIKTTSLSYDLSANANHGELTVTVRAFTSDTKYEDSPMSAPLKVTKLQAPQNPIYQSGKLSWNTVAGAAGYELTINGSPYTTTAPELVVAFVQGDNEITITAKGADDKVIHGVTTTKIFYGHLDPISGMTYQNNRVYWQAGENAKSFAVYVNGTYWKDFSRNYFDVNTDGFATEFGEAAHEIGIVCKTATMGIEPSEMKSYKVVLGNHIAMNDDQISWSGIGMGATYHISINGETPLQTGDTYLSMSQYNWRIGDNIITVTAFYNNTDYICETVKVIKHPAPTVSVSNGVWLPSDNNANNLYSVNGGAWSNTLPDISTLGVGENTVRAKRTVAPGSAFEIASDVVEIKIMRAHKPTIVVAGGKLQCQYDSAQYTLKLYYVSSGASNWTAISSVNEIIYAGEYQLRATLLPNASAFPGFGAFLESVNSDPITVTKLAAPTSVSYDAANHRVTSTPIGAKFYYINESGVECEVVGGDTSTMPGGVFEVYARFEAAGTQGVLDSANSFERAIVTNLDIALTLTRLNDRECNMIFTGCAGLTSLQFMYKVEYLDANGNVIGTGLDRTTSWTPARERWDEDTFNYKLNYLDGDFGGDLSQVKRIRITVYFDETKLLSETAEIPYYR